MDEKNEMTIEELEDEIFGIVKKEKQLDEALEKLRARFGDQAIRWGSDPITDSSLET